MLKIAITAANSAVGKTLLRHAASDPGLEVVACVRSAKAAAELPQSPRITACVVDYRERERMTAALAGCSCLVHLAGILMESPTSTYQAANVEATAEAVEVCRQARIGHLVLISVLGADPASSNRYLRSKGEGERVVADSGIPAAIIRTPILLGAVTAGGRALVHVASQAKATLLGGGRHTLRPLDVDDLSRAILGYCRAPRPGTQVYELVGPEPVAYRDLVARTAAAMGRQVAIRSMPLGLAKLAAGMAGLRKQGGMTPTVIDVITSSEDVHHNADGDLGITLTPLAETIAKLLPAPARVLQS